MQSHQRRVFDYEGKRAIAVHMTARLQDDAGIARDESGLREASRILTEHGDPRGLLAHRMADTHLHVLLACSRADAGMFARYALSGLRKRLGLGQRFEPARMRPVTSERHLLNGLRYVFTQEAHHGTSFDRAHDGSSLPEILGLRVETGQASRRVRRLLPRLTRESARAWLGIGDFEATVPNLALLRGAAAAAFGLDYTGSDEPAQRVVRWVAAHVAAQLAPGTDIAALLDVSPRCVQRYLREAPAEKALRAVELQLRLRTFLQRNEPDW